MEIQKLIDETCLHEGKLHSQESGKHEDQQNSACELEIAFWFVVT